MWVFFFIESLSDNGESHVKGFNIYSFWRWFKTNCKWARWIVWVIRHFLWYSFDWVPRNFLSSIWKFFFSCGWWESLLLSVPLFMMKRLGSKFTSGWFSSTIVEILKGFSFSIFDKVLYSKCCCLWFLFLSCLKFRLWLEWLLWEALSGSNPLRL